MQRPIALVFIEVLLTGQFKLAFDYLDRRSKLERIELQLENFEPSIDRDRIYY